MELIILGAGYGFPGVATMLKCNDSYYLIDAGVPVAELMHQHSLPFESLRAAFITHRHGDHIVGLSNLAFLSNNGYKKSPLQIYFPEECCLSGFRALMLSMKDSINETRLQMKLYEPGEFYRDENITVTAIPTDHINGLHPANALVIEGNGKRVVFTGDLHREDPYDFPKIAEEEPSDAVLCEFEHFHTDALLPHMKNCQTKQFLFHHYNAPWSLDELTCLQSSGQLPYPIHIVKDGDCIRI